jgi:hypothetical protein
MPDAAVRLATPLKREFQQTPQMCQWLTAIDALFILGQLIPLPLAVSRVQQNS